MVQPRRRFRTIAAAATAVLVLAGATPAAHGQEAPPRPAWLAVRGVNDALHGYDLRAPQPRWRHLGGRIRAVPAVAGTESGEVVFYAVGAGHRLWARTLDRPWQRVGPVGSDCRSVVAWPTFGDDVALACVSGGRHVYVAETTATRLTFDRWRRLPDPPGGLHGGIARSSLWWSPLTAVGVTQEPVAGRSTNVYGYGLAEHGWGPFWIDFARSPDPRYDSVCSAAPAVASWVMSVNFQHRLLLCPDTRGRPHAFGWGDSYNSPYTPVGHWLSGRVAGPMAVTAGLMDGAPIRAYGVGTDGTIFSWQHEYCAGCPTGGRWRGPFRLAGRAIGGIAATD